MLIVVILNLKEELKLIKNNIIFYIISAYFTKEGFYIEYEQE